MNRAPFAALPYLLLASTVFFWGTAFRATAIGAEHASPVVLATMRALPAGLALLLAAFIMRERLPRGRPLAMAAVTGLLMVTLTFEGIAEGTTLAGAGNAAVLINTSPFFVLLFGRAFFGERIASWGVIGLVTAFCGVVIMVSSQIGGDTSTQDMVLGMGLALAAGAGFGIGTLLVKATATRYPDIELTAFTSVQHLIGGAALIPLVFAYGNVGDTDWGSAELWEVIAWTALGSSAIASLAYYMALRMIPAARASTWTFLAPVIAVLVEIVYGQVPDAVVLGGMALAIVGVAVVSIAPAQAAAPSLPSEDAARTPAEVP